MEQQKKDKILALVTTIVLHIVVLFVLWLTFLGKEPIGTGSGVLVQVGFVDESAGMFESNADRPEQTEAERPRENEDELLTQTDEESIHIEKKEEKKDKTIQENKKDERIANQVKNAFGKGVSNDGSRGDSDEGSGTQGNPFGNSSTGEITGVGGYGGYNLGGRGLVGSLPYPEYDNSNDAGIIAISITVVRKEKSSVLLLRLTAAKAQHSPTRSCEHPPKPPLANRDSSAARVPPIKQELSSISSNKIKHFFTTELKSKGETSRLLSSCPSHLRLVP